MSFNRLLTSYHHPRVRELLKNAVAVGCSVAISRERGGICVGFAQKYIHRGGFDHKHAGVYIDFTTAVVRPDDGGPDAFVPINLGSVTEIADIRIRIARLPETPFWEGDVVAISDYHEKGGHVSCLNKWLIRRIDYNYLGRDKIYCEAVNLLEDDRLKLDATCTFPLENFSLLERGNLWKLEHDEPLDFSDIEEEAKFYQSLGMSEKLKVDLDGLEGTFDFKCGINAIREYHAHQMKLKNRTTMSFVLIKYHNQAFARRMREHTLRRYDS